MPNNEYLKVVSIESLVARSELIKKASEDFNEKSKKLLGKFNDQDLDFARNCKDYLKDHERAVVHLHFWENLNFDEISYVLKISVQLVKVILENAITHLRKIYEMKKQDHLFDFEMENVCKIS